MSPLNHKRTTSSLAQPIFYVAKKLAIKRSKAPHCVFSNSAARLHFVSIKSLNEILLSVGIVKTKKEYKRAEEIENEAFEEATSEVIFYLSFAYCV